MPGLLKCYHGPMSDEWEREAKKAILAGAFERLRAADPSFDEGRFVDWVASVARAVEGAFADAGLAGLRGLVSGGVYDRFEHLPPLKAEPSRPFEPGELAITRVTRDGPLEAIEVRVGGDISLACGGSVSRRKPPSFMREGYDLWIFARAHGSKAGWTLMNVRRGSDHFLGRSASASGEPALRAVDPAFSRLVVEDRAAGIFWRRAAKSALLPGEARLETLSMLAVCPGPNRDRALLGVRWGAGKEFRSDIMILSRAAGERGKPDGVDPRDKGWEFDELFPSEHGEHPKLAEFYAAASAAERAAIPTTQNQYWEAPRRLCHLFQRDGMAAAAATSPLLTGLVASAFVPAGVLLDSAASRFTRIDGLAPEEGERLLSELARLAEPDAGREKARLRVLSEIAAYLGVAPETAEALACAPRFPDDPLCRAVRLLELGR